MILFAAIRVTRRFIPRGWWRRPPYLPVPPWRYIEFRMHTFYGRVRLPPLGDVIQYVRWADNMQRRRW